MQQKYSDLICDFLKSHELISVNALEEKLQIPASTIGQALNGNRLIPSKHIYCILCELAKYGIKIHDFNLTLDEETDVIFGRRFIENIETIENESNFEYVIKEDRIFFSDYTDLI